MDALMKEYKKLEGRRIVEVRELKEEEYALFDWQPSSSHPGMIYILDNGQVMVPSMDPEGNGPGHIFVEQGDPA